MSPTLVVVLLLACLLSASVMVGLKAIPADTLSTMLHMMIGGALALLPARDATRASDHAPALGGPASTK
jgi:hypothetical protein